MYLKIVLIVYTSYLLIMSIVSFFMLRHDKRLAVKGSDRVQEKNLLTVAVFGGAIGSFIGRIVNHHKTNKLYFSVVIYLGMLLQISLLALFALMAYK